MMFSGLEKIPAVWEMFICVKAEILEQNDCIPYRASQIWQTVLNKRLSFTKSSENFQTQNKNMVLQFVPMLLLQAIHSPLRI